MSDQPAINYTKPAAGGVPAQQGYGQQPPPQAQPQPQPAQQYAPGWYPDPGGQFEVRYFDGKRWTDHVATQGQAQIAPLPGEKGYVHRQSADQVQQQVAKAGVASGYGAGHGKGNLFDAPVLVVNQKAKLIELTNEYAIYDSDGQPLGSVIEVGQSGLKKVVRFATSYDQFMTHKLEVRDVTGRPVLLLTRPAKLMKSKVLVSTPQGQQLGEIVQQNVFGKIRFSLESGGHLVGSLNAENWRAWNFAIKDHTETEVARITKTWEGLAKTMFTTADNYVLQRARPLQEPLRSLVTAAALVVDTALKQDSRGLG